EKVTAVIFNPLLLRRPTADGLRLDVGFRDGSLLTVAKVEADGDEAVFHLASGAVVRSHPFADIWQEINFLEPQGAQARYLSDLAPIDYKHVPLLALSYPLGVDQNVVGGRLRSGQRLFARGLGMHSDSRAVFALDREYDRFEAELAIDDSAGLQGSVVFRVLCDAGGSFHTVYQSPVVRGGDKPLPARVDIRGARRLALLVESADQGDVLDRANWLGARLVGGE
ncbi:MAG: NPCBM/NEW2 domain-containing protein, partial [Planctomycetales bacterium]|nr:NPCBM/NEW2 domain-containing protein [Planctomycetales bacterium]